MKDEAPIELGGRSFVPLTRSTLAHDIWFGAEARRSGLDTIDLREGETAESYAERVLDEVLRSGKALILLGGLIVPEGTDPLAWTPQMAAETARFIGALTEDEDKAKINSLVLALLMRFFSGGLVRWARSQGFSGRAAAEELRKRGAEPSPTSLGNGEQLFAPSPDASLIGFEPSSAGNSMTH